MSNINEKSFLTCFNLIRKGIVSGTTPDVHNEFVYDILNDKEKSLINNIFKATFHVDGVYHDDNAFYA